MVAMSYASCHADHDRKATFEGLNLAERIAETLSSLGVTVVSGFARGVDSSAHRGALKGRGKTVAVFGCGIDICYPAENKHLYEKVIYIVQGEGVAEFQQHGRVPHSIRWGTGSLFSAPLNSLHRLMNNGKEPAVFVAVTTAPPILVYGLALSTTVAAMAPLPVVTPQLVNSPCVKSLKGVASVMLIVEFRTWE